jgi:hypothetical protein
VTLRATLNAALDAGKIDQAIIIIDPVIGRAWGIVDVQ